MTSETLTCPCCLKVVAPVIIRSMTLCPNCGSNVKETKKA
jgi:predicted RNA-binding Zn-ribbon protein involved in translation (DUF1610 family)